MTLGAINAATFILSAGTWLLTAVVLALRAAGRGWPRRAVRRGEPLMLSGGLLILTAMLVSEFARDRGWPVHRLLVIDVLALAALVPAAACLLHGRRRYVRSSRGSGQAESGRRA